MKQQWVYILTWIPLVGMGATFNEISERAYSVSEGIMQSQGHLNTIGFEKASFMAEEPIGIETSARKIRSDNHADSGIEYGVMVDYSMKTPSFRSAQSYEFELQKKRALSEIKSQKLAIQIGLKCDWLLYQLEQERSVILGEKRDFSYKAYLDGEKKLKAGRLSKLELLRLKSEYDITLQEVASTLMEAEHAQHRLKEVTMMKDEIVIDDINFTFIQSRDLEERLNEAPLIKSLMNRTEMIDAQIATLRHSTLESLSFGIGMTQEPTQNSIDFRFTVPLVLSSKNENKIAALMSERSALVHVRDLAKEKLHISVSGLMEHLSEREMMIKRLRENEKHYETLFNMVQKGYEGGVIGQFEYLASKNAYYDARMRTLEMKQNYIEEMTVIEEKIGRIW